MRLTTRRESFWGGLWLASVAGLALLAAVIAEWVRQDIIHCYAQSESIRATATSEYPLGGLPSAWAEFRYDDLASALAAFLLLALTAIHAKVHCRWISVTICCGFMGSVFWRMSAQREAMCDIIGLHRIGFGGDIFVALLIAILLSYFSPSNRQTP